MSSPVSNKVLNEVIEKTNSSTGMYVQKVFKDTLRNLINVFGNTHYIDRNNNSIKVKCFHANQERAVAKTFIGDNITLPVITISETSTGESDKRRRYSSILISEKYWHKRKNKAVRVLSIAPRPIDVKYSINIWAKYKEDLDQIREYILTLFNPDLEIKTKNSNITKAFFVNESDAQQYEANDQEDRILKKTITINVETYIESPKFLYTWTGKIEKLNFEVTLEDKNVTETFTVSDGVQASVTHAEECFCTNCAIPISLFDGEQINLAISCSVGTKHANGCQCLDCILTVALIDGTVVNISSSCDGVDSIQEL
jgi:hypothetical protein